MREGEGGFDYSASLGIMRVCVVDSRRGVLIIILEMRKNYGCAEFPWNQADVKPRKICCKK